MGRNVLIDQNIFWKTIPNMEQGCHFLFFFPRIIQTFRHLDIHLLLRIVHDKIGFHVFRCQFPSCIFHSRLRSSHINAVSPEDQLVVHRVPQ